MKSMCCTGSIQLKINFHNIYRMPQAQCFIRICWVARLWIFLSHLQCSALVTLKPAASNSKMHAALFFICWVRTPDPLRGDDSRPPAASWCQWRRDALRHLKRERTHRTAITTIHSPSHLVAAAHAYNVTGGATCKRCPNKWQPHTRFVSELPVLMTFTSHLVPRTFGKSLRFLPLDRFHLHRETSRKRNLMHI